MGLFDFLLAKKQTASIAKDRLRIIVAHERAGRGSNSPDYLPMLQRELLEVIRKYINVDAEAVKVDLIGDGDTVPRLDEPREIAFHRMCGDAAHRNPRAAMLAARGQRDIEHRAGDLRIVEEQLEEIAHAIEEQAIGRLGLERQILRHHRGGGGVGHHGTR